MTHDPAPELRALREDLLLKRSLRPATDNQGQPTEPVAEYVHDNRGRLVEVRYLDGRVRKVG